VIARETFFKDAAVLALFRGDYSPGQSSGINAIFDEWAARKYTDLRWLAYILATAFHETQRKMQPIDEYGGPDYWFRMYDPEGDRPDFARENGNIYPGDGVKFHGRGLPQLTWRNNYRTMGTRLKVDLEGKPDLALVPAIAIQIMFEGMVFGLYTGKSLGMYFNDTRDAPIDARRIVNGTDKAELIAGYHRTFLAALRSASA